MSRPRVLFIVNKKIPDNDYRLNYGKFSTLCDVVYGLTGRPASLDPAAYVHMGFSEGFRPSYLLDFVLLFFHLLRRRKEYALVHFFSTNLILLGPLVAWLAGVPSIVTVTGFGRVSFNTGLKFTLLRRVYMALLGLSARATRRVLFQNHGDMNYLAGRLPQQARKFVYIGSAVSMPVVAAKQFNGPRLRVLLVARLMPGKGIDDFLKVAAALRGDDFEFVLVGPPSVGYDDTLAAVREAQSQGLIEYPGELLAAPLLDGFARAHVFFFPSRHEGMPRVMLEAGFAQVCPVAYTIPANLDLVAADRGFLLEPGDLDGVVATLKQLAADRDLLQSNAKNYQQFILANYSIEVYAQRMDEIIRRVMQRRSRRA